MDPPTIQPPSLVTISTILLLNLGCFLFLSSSSFKKPANKNHKKKKTTNFFNPSSSSSISPSTPTHSPPPNADNSTPPAPPSKRHSFASRVDIFPCSACGEVFSRTHLLDLHVAGSHALSELPRGESGRDIVRIIFESGWKSQPPAVEVVLKVQSSARTLARFEEHRQAVRNRAAARVALAAGVGVGRRSDEERCMADGNERLRFYCSTYLCSLARGRNPGTCGSSFCSTCEIVRNGFAGKAAEADGGVGTYSTGSAAHAALPEGLEEEFSFMNVRRAMLICRVVAGRVAREDEAGDAAYECDSVAVSRGGAEELVVFNPRAVLPCFVVVYKMV